MPEKPTVLVIGDSISMGYTPHVAELLAGQAAVVHNEGNGGDSDRVAASLEAWLAAAGGPGGPAAVHFNAGLHDIKINRQTRRHQVPPDRYERNLRGIVARLTDSGARLMWATTTPVIDARHQAAKDFDRTNADVDAYNAVAGRIMAEAGIAVDDLNAAAVGAGLEGLLAADGVHFTEDGYRLLGGVVAERIAELLP
jgi:lysophospholipase L1-like esterase